MCEHSDVAIMKVSRMAQPATFLYRRAVVGRRRCGVRLAAAGLLVLVAGCAPISIGDRGEPPPVVPEHPVAPPSEVTGPVSPLPEPSPPPEELPKPIQVDVVDDPALRETVGPKASREAILRVQVLLDRARFSVGEIDAKYGRNTRSAISAFQGARGLRRTGVVDDATWSALAAGTDEKMIVPHLITAPDASIRFVTLPRGMMARAKLPRLGYESGLEAVGERFHVSPELLVDMNPEKRFERPGEVVLVPNVRAGRPPAAASVVVDASDSAVMALDAGGRILAWYPATTGSAHDPLPIGDWAVTYIARTPHFHYYPKLFWDAPAGDRPAVLAPGPNNPVGVVWIDLTKEHYGIHGTPEPSMIGHTQSHGCIRLTNWDASELARMIGPGTPVVLRK